MKSKKLLVIAIIFLLGALLISSYFPAKTNKDFDLLQIIPERLRAFIAARLWEKADHLMHQGPIIDKQNFFAGSYAGNTDIIPYLKMVITLYPDETVPYRLLASNYAYHLNMEDEAIKLINEAISKCKDKSKLHELYASAAFIYFFSHNQRASSIDNYKLASYYIDKAIEEYKEVEILQEPVFKLENYYILKARIMWEMNEPDKALLCWQYTGKNLEDSNDNIAKLLLNYKNNGVVSKFATPLSNINTNEEKKDFNTFYNDKHTELEHKHDNHNHTETTSNNFPKNNKSPLQTMIWLTFKAGFIMFVMIIWLFLCSKSYGIDSSSFRFFPRS